MHRTKKLLLAGLVLPAAMVSAPLAVGAGENEPLDGGARNPSANETQSLTRETEVIADTTTYGTRQSNKSNNGGGAIYGCRSGAGGTQTGNEPCIRSNNLSTGRAFEFETDGIEVGRIESRNPAAAPFTTNATGVATGLNADRLDGKDADQIRDEAVTTAATQRLAANQFAAVGADGSLQAGDRGVASAARTATGVYTVVFDGDVSKCAYGVTVTGGDNAGGFGWIEVVDGKTLRVRTRSADASEAADRAFHVTATC